MTNHWKEVQQKRWRAYRNHAMEMVNSGKWTLQQAFDFLNKAGVPEEESARVWQGVIPLIGAKHV
jgi:hypothetical protein